MKRIKFFIMVASLVLATTAMVSCEKKVVITIPPIAVTTISLDSAALTLVIGEDYTLAATVLPDDAIDKTVTWQTSDAAKATVVDGKVTAVAVGTVTITAKAGNETATCVVSIVPINFITVSSGNFIMGCTGEQGVDCYAEESPAHSVTLNSFLISQMEITQGLWLAVMGGYPTTSPFNSGNGDNYPMYFVSWEDIVGSLGGRSDFGYIINGVTYYTNGFCYMYSQYVGDGKQYRLPTEAEWEYAARGGNTPNGYKYAGSNTLADMGWYIDNSGSASHAVATKSPNELGIYDMSGNVWEWCSDWYGTYSAMGQQNPIGASSGSARVNRGGNWSSLARLCRVANRNSAAPGTRGNGLGFRLACSLN
jgi:formylglycine-generating enzyme required for sulfatase activity